MIGTDGTVPRPANEAARSDAREILAMLDAAVEDNGAWLQMWHRAIVCRMKPAAEVMSPYSQYMSRFGSWLDLNRDRGLVDQRAFRDLADRHRDMHEFGRLLAQRASDGRPVPAAEYDAFMEKVGEFSQRARRLREAFRKAVSELDPLTGLKNRQMMLDALTRERERALRTGGACCVVLADIDRFKSVNDTHGHVVGDAVLLGVAARLLAHLRPYDEIYRYGGEEFLICLSGAEESAAEEVAERLRRALADEPIRLPDGRSLPITASFGLCHVRADVALSVTIERADAALYAAKRAGRNRVVLWTEAECGRGR